MKKLLAIAGLGIWLIGSGWYYTCKIKERCFSNAPPVPSTEIQALKAPVMFAWGSDGPLTSPQFPAYKDSILNLAKAGKMIQLTGQYCQDEPAKSKDEDLGLARAKAERLLFPEIPDSLFVLKSEVIPCTADFKTNSFVASAIMTIEGKPVAEAVGGQLFYFASGSSKRLSDPRADEYLLKLEKMIKTSDKKVEITGYTDNTGTPEMNLGMGMKRANSIKNLLVSKGVPGAKIAVFTKGEQNPIASNDTEEGKAKNRRAEIIVK